MCLEQLRRLHAGKASLHVSYQREVETRITKNQSRGGGLLTEPIQPTDCQSKGLGTERRPGASASDFVSAKGRREPQTRGLGRGHGCQTKVSGQATAHRNQPFHHRERGKKEGLTLWGGKNWQLRRKTGRPTFSLWHPGPSFIQGSPASSYCEKGSGRHREKKKCEEKETITRCVRRGGICSG